jgi:hypothetical protein
MATKRGGASERGGGPVIAGLLGTLEAVSAWLTESNVEFAVIGGVAASLHGNPRVTKDVDVVALAADSSWAGLLAAAGDFDLHARIADALEFAKVTRVLLLVHEPSAIEVDVSFGMLPFEAELVRRASLRSVRNVRFPLASAEDVIVMKALALRPRDIADIEGIVAIVQNLDLQRVRAIVEQLSAALEGEDHLARLDQIIEQARRA